MAWILAAVLVGPWVFAAPAVVVAPLVVQAEPPAQTAVVTMVASAE